MIVEEAIERITDGSRIGLGGGSATPQELGRVVRQRTRELRSVSVVSGLQLGGYEFLAERNIRFESWFPPRTLTRQSVDPKTFRHLPFSWFQACQYVHRHPVDIALIQVAPSHRRGYFSLGTSSGYVRPMVDAAKLVVAEVNERMPYTFGDSEIPVERVDAFMNVDYPLPEISFRDPSEAERTVVDRCVQFIDGSAPLQVGVGTIPNAVLATLTNKGHRGSVYSFLNDGFLERLIQPSSRDPREVWAEVGEIGGSRELYESAHLNRHIRMMNGLESHDPGALAARPRMVYLNSCVEMDIFGQINNEFISGELGGGAGGSVDFLSAGARADRTSIIAFTAEVGSRNTSRIVAALDDSLISVSRFHTGIVVTEHGSVDLRFLSARERCDALIGLASPTHRGDLEKRVAAYSRRLGT